MGREPEPRAVLSPEELRILEAAMARVLPSVDGPGATEANAIGHVEWLVSEGRSAAVVEDLKLAAALLDAIARGLWDRPFAACAAEEQELAMQRFEGTPHARVQQAYGTLVKTTLAGFLCPPEYGGNRNECGWRHLDCRPVWPAAHPPELADDDA